MTVKPMKLSSDGTRIVEMEDTDLINKTSYEAVTDIQDDNGTLVISSTTGPDKRIKLMDPTGAPIQAAISSFTASENNGKIKLSIQEKDLHELSIPMAGLYPEALAETDKITLYKTAFDGSKGAEAFSIVFPKTSSELSVEDKKIKLKVTTTGSGNPSVSSSEADLTAMLEELKEDIKTNIAAGGASGLPVESFRTSEDVYTYDIVLSKDTDQKKVTVPKPRIYGVTGDGATLKVSPMKWDGTPGNEEVIHLPKPKLIGSMQGNVLNLSQKYLIDTTEHDAGQVAITLPVASDYSLKDITTETTGLALSDNNKAETKVTIDQETKGVTEFSIPLTGVLYASIEYTNLGAPVLEVTNSTKGTKSTIQYPLPSGELKSVSVTPTITSPVQVYAPNYEETTVAVTVGGTSKSASLWIPKARQYEVGFTAQAGVGMQNAYLQEQIGRRTDGAFTDGSKKYLPLPSLAIDNAALAGSPKKLILNMSYTQNGQEIPNSTVATELPINQVGISHSVVNNRVKNMPSYNRVSVTNSLGNTQDVQMPFGSVNGVKFDSSGRLEVLRVSATAPFNNVVETYPVPLPYIEPEYWDIPLNNTVIPVNAPNGNPSFFTLTKLGTTWIYTLMLRNVAVSSNASTTGATLPNNTYPKYSASAIGEFLMPVYNMNTGVYKGIFTRFYIAGFNTPVCYYRGSAITASEVIVGTFTTVNHYRPEDWWTKR